MARRRSTRRGKGSVFEQPNGTWRGKVTTGYDEAGKQRFRWVSGKTQAEALAEVAELRQRLASDTYTDTKPTVKSYRENWLKEKGRHVKPSTIDTYTNLCEKHVTPKLGRKGLDKLTPLDVQNP